MKQETISQVQILEGGELVLTVESGGNPNYQYVYREGKEVYWDERFRAFKSPKPRDWGYAKWFQHIVMVAREINIDLQLTEGTDWINVPAEIKGEILETAVT